MVKLKTLKDLPTSDCDCCKVGETNYTTDMPVYASKLREEAKKWIKALEKSIPEDEYYRFQDREDNDCFQVINWIKHFFNLK